MKNRIVRLAEKILGIDSDWEIVVKTKKVNGDYQHVVSCEGCRDFLNEGEVSNFVEDMKKGNQSLIVKYELSRPIGSNSDYLIVAESTIRE